MKGCPYIDFEADIVLHKTNGFIVGGKISYAI